MKIETELGGKIVIAPDGQPGSLVFVRLGRVHRVTEVNGQIRTEELGRALGFIYGKPYVPGEKNETLRAEAS